MKIYTVLRNLIQGIKNALQESKDYTDARGDYIVEEGTSGIWTYRKWASGIAECWGDTTISLNFDQRISTSSYLYVASAGASVALPSGLFTSIKIANANGHDNVSRNWAVYYSVNPTTTDLQINPLAWNTGGSRTYTVQMFVKGLWKAFTPSVSRLSP